MFVLLLCLCLSAGCHVLSCLSPHSSGNSFCLSVRRCAWRPFPLLCKMSLLESRCTNEGSGADSVRVLYVGPIWLSGCRPNILYEVRLKCPEEGAEDDDECVAGDREAETEFAAKDLAREIKQKHSTDIGIVYCLRKKDCEIVRHATQFCYWFCVPASLGYSLARYFHPFHSDYERHVSRAPAPCL